MNRIGNDELLAHSPNLTFRSSFSLSGNAIEQNSKKSLSTALSGLGWYFTLRFVAGKGLKKGGKSKKIRGPKIYVDIDFDKAFITSTRYSVDCVACAVLNSSDLDTVHDSFDQECVPLATHNIGTLRIATTRDYTITFTVKIGEHNLETPPTMHQNVARALSDTMRTGHFIDTKVYVYSQRSKSGARDPKVLWASSRVVHMFGSEALSLLFAHDVSGCVPIDVHTLDDDDDRIDGYDYESDSDLEDDTFTPPISFTDEPTHWSLDLSPEALPGSVPHLSRSRSISPVLLIPQAPPQSQSPPTSSPRILTPTSSPSLESSSSWTPSTPGPFAKPSFAESPMSPSELLHQRSLTSTNFLRMGRVLVLRDGAYRTWKALLHYVYFQDVEFARLRSDLESRGDSPTASEFQCSPKSMYRLANKYGLDALKSLALQSIQQQLSTTNIIKELFSKFTSLYPEVMTLEMEFLMKNRSNDLVQRGLRGAIMRGQDSRVVGEIMVALLRG